MAQFGTDGFRGRAESFSKHGLMKIGEKLAKTGLNGKIVIGRDTRESSDEFYEAIVSGINSVGHNVIDLGVVTTPCVSYFSRVIADAKYGIMITASHNPYYDNGIKIFEHGNKIDEKLEKKLFDAYSLERQETRDKRIEIKDKRVETRDCSSYLKYVSRGLDLNRVSDKKIVVDLANGSASFLAKKIFGSDNFDELFSEVEYLESLNSDLNDTLKETELTKANLELDNAEQTQQLENLQALESDLESGLSQLEGQETAKNVLLENTQSSEAQYRVLMSEMRQEQSYITSQIINLQREIEKKISWMSS